MRRIFSFFLFMVILSVSFPSGADNGHMPFLQYISDEEILDDWAGILELDQIIDCEPQEKKLLDNLHSDNPPDFFAVSD